MNTYKLWFSRGCQKDGDAKEDLKKMERHGREKRWDSKTDTKDDELYSRTEMQNHTELNYQAMEK